jgi:hypothetical protein
MAAGKRGGRVSTAKGIISAFQDFGVFYFGFSTFSFFGVSLFSSVAPSLRGSVARSSSSFPRQPAAFSP